MNIYAQRLSGILACLLLVAAVPRVSVALGWEGRWGEPSQSVFSHVFSVRPFSPPSILKSFFAAPGAVPGAAFLAEINAQTEPGAILGAQSRERDKPFSALIYVASFGAVLLLIGLVTSLVLMLRHRMVTRELELAEQRYRAMFENAVEGIFYVRPDGELEDGNTALAKMLGYDDVEGLLAFGQQALDVLVDPEEGRALASCLEEVGVVKGADLRVRRRDGQERIFWVTLRAVREGEGSIDFIEGRAMDVTDDRRIRAELETNRERLRLALETSSDGIWDYNVQSGSCYYSPRYFTMLGYEADNSEQPREVWAKLLHPADRAEAMFKMAQFESGAMPEEAFEAIYRMKCADGGYRWILSRSKAVHRDPLGAALRIIGINMDITELKKVQEELGELNRDLERRVESRTQELSEANTALAASLEALSRMHDNLVQSEKMAALGGLVAGVAHEINTPVGLGVTSASWLLECTETTAKRLKAGELKRSELDKYMEISRESCVTILTNLSRAADLVQSFKQVAVDQTAGDARDFDLDELIKEVLLSMRPKYKRTKHKVQVDIPGGIVMYSYPGDLMQVITNLMMNSLLHAFEGIDSGVISISARKSGPDSVVINFDDNGQGVDPDQIKLLFDPFYTTKQGQGGTGLGLHIIYNLVTQKLKGLISCSGEKGHGLHYMISVPCDIRKGGLADE